MIVNTGRWSEAELDSLMRKASLLRSPGERVELISRMFLGTAYLESTLKGSTGEQEVPVINLAEVDCFTFLDYVEAMRISESMDAFKKNLMRVRYRGGMVSFRGRNHFFTDWIETGADRVNDVTALVGRGKEKKVVKMLNLRADGSPFLPGAEIKKREISFIPSADLSADMRGRLESGDYAGIYSELEGLDVSHAGIIIKTGNTVYLRHASSREGVRKVLDEDFFVYMAARPGLVLLRPRD